MSKRVMDQLADMDKKGEDLSQFLISLGFKHDIISRSYLDPGSNYGITFYWSGPTAKPIFLPYIVYHPQDPSYISESEYVEWEEFFEGISDSIRDKMIFHLDIFR